jgi:hypothetical protein
VSSNSDIIWYIQRCNYLLAKINYQFVHRGVMAAGCILVYTICWVLLSWDLYSKFSSLGQSCCFMIWSYLRLGTAWKQLFYTTYSRPVCCPLFSYFWFCFTCAPPSPCFLLCLIPCPRSQMRLTSRTSWICTIEGRDCRVRRESLVLPDSKANKNTRSQ